MLDKTKALQMKESGLTYQEIANVFGCTRQNVQQSLSNSKRKKYNRIFLNKSFEKVIFPSLIIWCKDNNINSIADFRNIVNIVANDKSMRNKMQGKNEFTLSEIRKILEVTKMTFEDAFKVE